MPAGYRTTRLDAIATVSVPDPDVPGWKPVRRELGIGAFGANAYVAAAGEVVVEPHDEVPEAGEEGHQEIYLVVSGSARFTVAGDEFDVAQGGIVFLEDPALHRMAVALEDGTVVFAVGAPHGGAYAPPSWEDEFLREAGAG